MRELEIHHNGDLIRRVEFKKGNNIRPLWQTMEGLSPQEMLIWVDRMDSLCPVACSWSLASAFESSAKIQVSKRMQAVRSIYCEINRLVYLTTYLGNIIKSLGVTSLYQQMMILREQVFQKQEELMGGRILPQVIRIGGVRRDLALGDVQKVKLFLNGWNFNWQKWKEITIDDPLLEERLDKLLKISLKNVKQKSLWGLIGKASGLVYDSRLHQPHGAYPYTELKLNYDFALKEDALSRFKVAVFEVDLALSLAERLLNLISDQTEDPIKDFTLKEGFFSGVAESARGPVVSVIEVDGSSRVRSVKLFNTSQRIWPQIESSFTGLRAEDFELAWASLGISGEEAEV